MLLFCCQINSAESTRGGLFKNNSKFRPKLKVLHYIVGLAVVVNLDFCWWKQIEVCTIQLWRGLLKRCGLLFKYEGLLDICSTASEAHPCHIPGSCTRNSAHCWHLQTYLFESNCTLYGETSPIVPLYWLPVKRVWCICQLWRVIRLIKKIFSIFFPSRVLYLRLRYFSLGFVLKTGATVGYRKPTFNLVI